MSFLGESDATVDSLDDFNNEAGDLSFAVRCAIGSPYFRSEMPQEELLRLSREKHYFHGRLSDV